MKFLNLIYHLKKILNSYNHDSIGQVKNFGIQIFIFQSINNNFFSVNDINRELLESNIISEDTNDVSLKFRYLPFEEYLVKLELIEKNNIARVWDVLRPVETTSSSCDDMFLYTFHNEKESCYHIFHEKGRVGEFLKGFFGYNSNPNYIEFFLWLFFFFFEYFGQFIRIKNEEIYYFLPCKFTGLFFTRFHHYLYPTRYAINHLIIKTVVSTYLTDNNI